MISREGVVCEMLNLGLLSLLVVNVSTNKSLAQPHLVTRQRVAPSGEIRVLQLFYTKRVKVFVLRQTGKRL